MYFHPTLNAAFPIQSKQIEVEKFLIMEVFHQLNKERMIKFEYHHFATPNELVDQWLSILHRKRQSAVTCLLHATYNGVCHKIVPKSDQVHNLIPNL